MFPWTMKCLVWRAVPDYCAVLSGCFFFFRSLDLIATVGLCTVLIQAFCASNRVFYLMKNQYKYNLTDNLAEPYIIHQTKRSPGKWRQRPGTLSSGASQYRKALNNHSRDKRDARTRPSQKQVTDNRYGRIN